MLACKGFRLKTQLCDIPYPVVFKTHNSNFYGSNRFEKGLKHVTVMKKNSRYILDELGVIAWED